jgi:hypothetical protein
MLRIHRKLGGTATPSPHESDGVFVLRIASTDYADFADSERKAGKSAYLMDDSSIKE